MSIAGEWYSSGTFWTAAGVVVAVVVGGGTVAVTYLTRFARQRLEYGLRTVVSLLGALDGIHEVELLHRGVKLERPYLAEVVLAGRGRRDIPRAAFDNGDPIRLDLGVPVVEVLEVEAVDSASATPAPQVRAEGNALLVGPALIGRRQYIALKVLVEGRPRLGCEAPLPNAVVRRRSFDSLEGLRKVFRAMFISSLAASSAAGALLGLLVPPLLHH